ncbi:MAG: Zn-dependent exopeptidase M28 [Clostridia bacterium]|nr:Zn-dependent exopeptidase M28 [Clostridia bacterium]
MSYSNYSPLKFVENLSFVRYGGTEAELKAAKLILAEIEASGGKGEITDFEINASDYKGHVTKIVKPYELDINTVAFGMCGSIPAPGKDLKVLYAERGTDMDFLGYDDLSEYVVLVDQLSLDCYKALVQRKAAAIFVIMGKYYHDNGEAGLYNRNLRPKQLEQGVIPTFAINAHDATELLRNEAELIHIELEQTDGKATSRNVLAVIEGTEKPEESIVLTAHYDSLPIGPGAWDNATGSAAIMGLYKYFLENPPKRTLRFIWCGSEEQGLLGSKAYIEQHEDLMPSIKFCFNFDMCGTILGPNNIGITGDKTLEDFVELFLRETGYSASTRAGVHSSDSAPFADRGVPAIGLSRGTRSSEIHTSRDTIFPLGEKQLKANIEFAHKIISRVVNAVLLPVGTGMPDNMKKELDKYFQREPASNK